MTSSQQRADQRAYRIVPGATMNPRFVYHCPSAPNGSNQWGQSRP